MTPEEIFALMQTIARQQLRIMQLEAAVAEARAAAHPAGTVEDPLPTPQPTRSSVVNC